MSLKPRLGDIATPGRVCSPHNEIYDCRIRPNGIGCLRRRSTRRRLGCRPAARPAGQEPVFRADSASERNDLPIRSARFPMKAPGGLQFRQRAEKRERRSKTNSPGIVLSVRRRTAPRATEPEMRPGRERSVRKSGSEEGSCDRSPGYARSVLPDRNAGRTRNICQTLCYTKTQNINEGFILMKVIETALEGVVILEPELHRDARGYFFESYSQKLFDRSVRPVRFVQDNESRSSYGVLRGLHFQRGEHAQGKLVRVVEGAVLDVAVDIRRGSPTFGRHVAVELSGENRRQLFIPRGFAHGFVVLSEEALFQYKCDNCYAPQSEGAIAWNDPQIGIDWRIDPANVILSEKDSRHPRLDEAPELFDYDKDYYTR